MEEDMLNTLDVFINNGRWRRAKSDYIVLLSASTLMGSLFLLVMACCMQWKS